MFAAIVFNGFNYLVSKSSKTELINEVTFTTWFRYYTKNFKNYFFNIKGFLKQRNITVFSFFILFFRDKWKHHIAVN